MRANASKHKAMSYGRMEEKIGELEAQVKELLAAAEGSFDVLLTNDRFLPREHDLARHGLGVVLLTTNRLREIEQLVPRIAAALTTLQPGEQTTLSPDPATSRDSGTRS